MLPLLQEVVKQMHKMHSFSAGLFVTLQLPVQDLTPKHLDKPEDLKVFEGMTSLELVLPAQVIHGALPYLSHLVFLQSLLMNGQWTHSSEPQACIEKLGTCRRLQKLQVTPWLW